MKTKKCPYCGKRVSYTSAYSSRRKGEFVCARCGKESKVVIEKKAYIFFAVFASVALAIMAGWILAGLSSNPWGVLLVAVPLVIFVAISPNFVEYEPLKKYKKSMEAKKAGREYSDNILSSEQSAKMSSSFSQNNQDSGNFQINTDVFNTIKAERNAARKQLQGDEIYSTTGDIEEKSYVPLIKDVSGNHASADAPLKKIHSESKTEINRKQHYIPLNSDSQTDRVKKPDTNRYSSNRKF